MLSGKITKLFTLGALLGAPLVAPVVSNAAENETKTTHAATATAGAHKFSMYAGVAGAGMFIQKGDVTFKDVAFHDAGGAKVTGLTSPNVRTAGSDIYSLTPMIVEADKGWGFSGGVLLGAGVGDKASIEFEAGFLANKQLEGATALPKTAPASVDLTAVVAGTGTPATPVQVPYQVSAFAPTAVDGSTATSVKFSSKKFIKYHAPYGTISGLFKLPVGGGKVSPFVQAGIGLARITAKFDDCETAGNLRENAATIGSATPTTAVSTNVTSQDTAEKTKIFHQLPLATVLTKDKYIAKTAVLGQGGAGVSFDVSKTVSLSVAYRFMMPFSDPDFKSSNADSASSSGATAKNTDNKITVDIRTHSLLAAVRFCL